MRCAHGECKNNNGVCQKKPVASETCKNQKWNKEVRQTLLHYVNRIGVPSSNGFIDHVSDGVRSYVLKSCAQATADNLMYEYFTGKYLNHVVKRLNFKCFLETYAMYMYKSNALWRNAMMKPHLLTGKLVSTVASRVTADTFDFTRACRLPTKVAILIEYISGNSLKQYVATPAWVEQNLLEVLLQLYIPLSLLAEEFTHYDFHTDNVMLVPNATEQVFHYIYNNAEIKFKSKFTAKIIDYGRCYFKDPTQAKIRSSFVYKEVCKTRSCNSRDSGDCGTSVGFGWLRGEDEAQKASNFYINSSIPNKSHDLRLLQMLHSQLSPYPAKKTKTKLLYGLLDRVVFTDQYGTAPAESNGTTQIRNVHDAAAQLIQLSRKIKGV